MKKKRKLGRNRSNFGLWRSGWVEMDAGGWPSDLPDYFDCLYTVHGGRPLVPLPETSDEKGTTGKMGYDQ